MFSDYKTQIDQILKNTEKEEANNIPDRIAAAAMYKIMIAPSVNSLKRKAAAARNLMPLYHLMRSGRTYVIN